MCKTGVALAVLDRINRVNAYASLPVELRGRNIGIIRCRPDCLASWCAGIAGEKYQVMDKDR